MTLVAFVSGRSPGLTTSVHALSRAWPRIRRAVVAELDPDGGCLGVRQELSPEPGLTTLAAAGRRGLAPDAVLGHCQQLRDGTVALLAPVAPERAASALSVLSTRLAVALDALAGVDVLADCGRIDTRSPALELTRSARYVVLVTVPTLEGVAHSQGRLKSLELAPGRVAVLTIGSRPYRPDEVGAALDLPVLGSLANDRRGADELAAGRVGRRSELLRSATAVAERLASHLAPVVPEDAPPAPGWSPTAATTPAAQPQIAPAWSPPNSNRRAASRAGGGEGSLGWR
jgi:hypothetical protein